MVDKKKVILDEAGAEQCSSYFRTIGENLDLQNKAEKLTDDALSNIIRNSENHPSIFKIKNNV